MFSAFFGEVEYALKEVFGFFGLFFPELQHFVDSGTVAEHLFVKAASAFFVFHLHDFPDGIIVLVVGDEGEEFCNFVVELVFQQINVDGFVFFGGVLKEFGHINGLPEVDHSRAAVTEVITIFYGSGDDVNGTFVAKLLVGIDGDVEQPLAHAHQRVLGAVCAFREEIEFNAVVDDIDSFVERIVVIAHRGHTIANAEDRKDAQKIQNLGHRWVFEYVASRDENFPDIVR